MTSRSRSWTPCSSSPGLREAVLERFHVDTRYIAAGAAGRFAGRHRRSRTRDGRLWHDLTDEFGVTWSMPDDQPYYMDISHHPLADATIADLDAYPFPKGDDPGRFAGLRQRAAGDPPADALRRGERDLRRGLRDLLVSARAGAVVHGHAHAAGVLRGAPGSHAAVLDGLVPRVPGRGGRPGRRDHDRRRPGRAERAACSGPTSTAASSSRGTSGNWSSTSARGPGRRSGTTPAARAPATFPTCLDNGIDILNPVQISAAGMEPAVLKARFGDRLVFWGGAIDAQHVLPTRLAGNRARGGAAEP